MALLLVRQRLAPAVVKLSFPPDLTADQVETVLGTIAGLPRRARVRLSIEAHAGRLTFLASAAPRDLDAIRGALQGIAPAIRLEDAAPDRALLPAMTARIGWRGSYLLLRRDQRELSVAALLAVLRSTEGRERMRFVVHLKPLVRPTAPRLPADQAKTDVLAQVMFPQPTLPRDQVRLIRQQYAGPLLSARIELHVWSSSRARAQQLLNQVVAVIRARSGPRGRFSTRTHRWAWPGVGLMLAPAELVGLVGWPLEGPAVPSLRYNRAPQLLPDDAIPERGPGRTFGVSNWPGLSERRLIQPTIGAQSHTIVLGPTGSGKSALLTRLLVADLEAGHGALLLDMKGDTANDALERIPAARKNDVVVLDPAQDGPLPGLKALHSGDPELVADLWVGVFRNLFSDSWGIRSERYIRLGVQTLACQPGAVITDLPRVFHDLTFRRQLLSASQDPLLGSAWASFDALSAGQQAEHLAAPLGKVQDVVGRRVVRDVLGQADPKLELSDALQSRKIVVVRLAPGRIGQATAQLLGALIIWEAYQAVLGRQGLPASAREPFGIYVDEPAVLNALPVPLDSLFELARGLGVGVTLAAQSLTQLPAAVRKAALTNVATIACFQAGADDAALIARELVGVTADQLQHLNQYEIALRMGLNHGLRAPVTTASTLPPLKRTSQPAALRRASARRYGGTAVQPSRSNQSDQPGQPGTTPGPPDPGVPPTSSPNATPLGRVRRAQ